MAYTKNIAVIKEIKDGFSADGGNLSGLIKAEKYGLKLKVEVTYLNFAPLSEGRYVCAISDGVNTVAVENGLFEGETELDTGGGFGALVCFVNGAVFPIASAVCGNFHYAVLGLKSEVERLENLKTVKTQKYEDEAISEDNYFEYEDNESGGVVRADKEEEKNGGELRQNEKTVGSVEEKKSCSGGLTPEYPSFNGLAGGAFYEKVRDEIENIFKTYPAEENLQSLIEGSRWAKIDYGDGRFYVFGVLYSGGNAEYICYGVPTAQSATPPESMRELASFIPVKDGESERGFWIMYQDAKTGASVKITNT